jgi:N-acetylmuramoyl-L-alanine amidase
MNAKPIQQAPFRVLAGANMPAVLVEAAFLTNAEQERQLQTSAFQTEIVQALFDAVVRFRAHVEQGTTER